MMVRCLVVAIAQERTGVFASCHHMSYRSVCLFPLPGALSAGRPVLYHRLPEQTRFFAQNLSPRTLRRVPGVGCRRRHRC